VPRRPSLHDALPILRPTTTVRAVPTFTGDIAAEEVGETLLHEHLFVRQPDVDRALPDDEWDADRAVHEAVVHLDALHDRGVRTVVDLTVPRLGRDVRLVIRGAKRTRMRLVAASSEYSERAHAA